MQAPKQLFDVICCTLAMQKVDLTDAQWLRCSLVELLL